LRKSEKLDFASWGGYAQNYALRRIAFDDPASAEVYDRAPAELCSIPTFASNLDGIYLPASVLKGAIRLALLVDRVSENQIKSAVESLNSDMPRRAAGNPKSPCSARRAQPDPGRAALRLARHLQFSHKGLSAADRDLDRAWRQTRSRLEVGARLGGFQPGDGCRPVFRRMAVPGTVSKAITASRCCSGFRRPARRFAGRIPFPVPIWYTRQSRRYARIERHRKFAETAGLVQITLCATRC